MELNKETALAFIDALAKQGKFNDFLAGLAKAQQNDFVRAIAGVVGAERFQKLLGADKTGIGTDPIAAAVKERNADLAGMLIAALGSVPHKISNMSPIHTDYGQPKNRWAVQERAAPVSTVTCRALEDALGLEYGAIRPDRAQTPFEPDVRLVKMLLDAMPDVHPETYLHHAVEQPYVFGQSGKRSVTLTSLAIISRNADLVQLMLDRDPQFVAEDLLYAVHMGNADVAIQIIEKTGGFPSVALRLLESMELTEQRKLVPVLAAAEMEYVPAEKLVLPQLRKVAPEVVLLLHEKAGVPLDRLLIESAAAGSGAAVEAVLKAGANASARINRTPGNREFTTALHEARGAEVVNILLAAGADPNETDTKGQPPIVSWLQRSTGTGEETRTMVGMISALAAGGADMAVKHEGRSLLQLAGKWEEEVRRAVRAGKTGMQLESAFSGDGRPSGPSSSSGGAAPL